MNFIHHVVGQFAYHVGQTHVLLAQSGIDGSAGFKQGLGKVLGNIIFPLFFVVGVLKAGFALYTSDRNENWKAGLTTAILLAAIGVIMTLAFQIFGLGGGVVTNDFSSAGGQ